MFFNNSDNFTAILVYRYNFYVQYLEYFRQHFWYIQRIKNHHNFLKKTEKHNLLFIPIYL